jgi:hypothetical protein
MANPAQEAQQHAVISALSDPRDQTQYDVRLMCQKCSKVSHYQGPGLYARAGQGVLLGCICHNAPTRHSLLLKK